VDGGRCRGGKETDYVEGMGNMNRGGGKV